MRREVAKRAPRGDRRGGLLQLQRGAGAVPAGRQDNIRFVLGMMNHIDLVPARPSAGTRGLAPVRGGGQQAQVTGARDGLGAPMRAELGVQVAHMGPDCVERDV